MAAVLQRLALICILIVPLTLVWMALDSRRNSPSMLALAILLLLLPPLILLSEFLLLRQYQVAAIRRQVPVTSLMRLWVGETLVAIKSFLWDQALREQRFPAVHFGGKSRRGIVLIHGYLCNRGFWNPWLERLRTADLSYVCLSVEPVFGSIDDSVQQIRQAVQMCTSETGAPPILVTHSMGGLSARAAMRAFGDLMQVHHVVTIACPHQGTALAQWGVHEKERQMRPGSAWLQELDQAESIESRAVFTCFYGDCDNVVFPVKWALLPGADNRLIQQRAHLQLAASPEVFEEVMRVAFS